MLQLMWAGMVSCALFACEMPARRLETYEFNSSARIPRQLSLQEIQDASQRGLAVDEKIDSIVVLPSRGLGQTVVQVVATSQDGDFTSAFVVDEDGIIQSTQDFWSRERASMRDRYGKMTPQLFERQIGLRDWEEIEVDIMIYVDVPEPQRTIDGTDLYIPVEEFETWTRAQTEIAEEKVKHAKSGVVDFLVQNDASIVLNARILPFIRANVPAAVLRSSELNSANVVWIDAVSSEPGSDLLGYAGRASMGASETSGGLFGGVCGGACNGGGIDVGLWESIEGAGNHSGMARNNSRISTGNVVTGYQSCPKACTTDTDCPDVQIFNSSFILRRRCQPPTQGGAKICVQDHLSWVAASIGMFGGYDYTATVPGTSDPAPNIDPCGAAPLRPCFSSTGAYDADFRIGNELGISGLDFLIAQGPVNPSEPCQQASAPATPYINRSQAQTPKEANWPGRALGTFLTAAAGNNSAAAVECALLKNGLCVGMSDYRTYFDPSTHVVSGFSSFVNDSNVDTSLERPHVLGPGGHAGSSSGLHMPSIDVAPPSSQMRHAGYDGGFPAGPISGTSFSAPTVLSAAIQAHQFEGWFSDLAFPMVNKAVLMAATRDGNADGAVGLANSWSQNAPTIDAKDGAGEIRFPALQAILSNNQYYWADLADSNFASCGTGCRKFTVSTLSIPASTRFRVALAWQSCMIEEGSTPVLNNDLDLALNCGSPLQVCGGTTLSNTVTSELEMFERPGCTYSKTCSIEIRIKNGATLNACGSTPTERVGIAWSYNS